MNTVILAISVAYVVMAVVLLCMGLTSRFKWWIKGFVIVVTCGTPQTNGQPIVKLTLVPETQGWPASKGGKPCPVYELVLAGAGRS